MIELQVLIFSITPNGRQYETCWITKQHRINLAITFNTRKYVKKPQNPQSNTGAVSTSDGFNSGNGRCDKCGKLFVYVGDVPDGGFIEGSEPYCTCNVKKQTVVLFFMVAANVLRIWLVVD